MENQENIQILNDFWNILNDYTDDELKWYKNKKMENNKIKIIEDLIKDENYKTSNKYAAAMDVFTDYDNSSDSGKILCRNSVEKNIEKFKKSKTKNSKKKIINSIDDNILKCMKLNQDDINDDDDDDDEEEKPIQYNKNNNLNVMTEKTEDPESIVKKNKTEEIKEKIALLNVKLFKNNVNNLFFDNKIKINNNSFSKLNLTFENLPDMFLTDTTTINNIDIPKDSMGTIREFKQYIHNVLIDSINKLTDCPKIDEVIDIIEKYTAVNTTISLKSKQHIIDAIKELCVKIYKPIENNFLTTIIEKIKNEIINNSRLKEETVKLQENNLEIQKKVLEQASELQEIEEKQKENDNDNKEIEQQIVNNTNIIEEKKDELKNIDDVSEMEEIEDEIKELETENENLIEKKEEIKNNEIELSNKREELIHEKTELENKKQNIDNLIREMENKLWKASVSFSLGTVLVNENKHLKMSGVRLIINEYNNYEFLNQQNKIKIDTNIVNDVNNRSIEENVKTYMNYIDIHSNQEIQQVLVDCVEAYNANNELGMTIDTPKSFIEIKFDLYLNIQDIYFNFINIEYKNDDSNLPRKNNMKWFTINKENIVNNQNFFIEKNNNLIVENKMMDAYNVPPVVGGKMLKRKTYKKRKTNRKSYKKRKTNRKTYRKRKTRR